MTTLAPQVRRMPLRWEIVFYWCALLAVLSLWVILGCMWSGWTHEPALNRGKHDHPSRCPASWEETPAEFHDVWIYQRTYLPVVLSGVKYVICAIACYLLPPKRRAWCVAAVVASIVVWMGDWYCIYRTFLMDQRVMSLGMFFVPVAMSVPSNAVIVLWLIDELHAAMKQRRAARSFALEQSVSVVIPHAAQREMFQASRVP